MIKILSKVRVEGMYLNVTKAIYEKPTDNVMGKNYKCFPYDQKQDRDVRFHLSYST